MNEEIVEIKSYTTRNQRLEKKFQRILKSVNKYFAVLDSFYFFEGLEVTEENNRCIKMIACGNQGGPIPRRTNAREKEERRRY